MVKGNQMSFSASDHHGLEGARVRDARSQLLEMLTFARPAYSNAEAAFIKRYILPTGASSDAAGNWCLEIGNAPILWSSHTDTVHGASGRQDVTVTGDVAALAHGSKSNCLGADCTTGVWLMLNMIEAGVPGFYVFHAAEERGGKGSIHIATKTPWILDGIKAAIALDRAGTDEVITHQGGTRMASDAFALSLARQLPGSYAPSPSGIFTDTANYPDLVGECVNIGVGYSRQHSSLEVQCLAHAERLRAALVEFDWTKLEFERQPGEEEPWHDAARDEQWAWFDEFAERAAANDRRRSAPVTARFVRDNADLVTDYLEQLGVTVSDITGDESF